MIFINKSTGRLKVIGVEFDLDYADKLLQKAELINRHVDEDTMPEEYCDDPDECERCSFFDLCAPPITREPIDIISDPEIIETVEQMMSLKEAVKKHNALEREVKKIMKDQRNTIVGKFRYTAKEITRDGYEVKPSTYMKGSWKEL